MDGKKSFVLFNDLSVPVKSLSDEEAGKLFKAIFEYQNGGIQQELTGAAGMAFVFVKQQLDRNQEKYNAICKRNRINGMKGGRLEKPKEPSGLIGNPEEPKEPSGLIGNPEEPKKPDTDSDNDTDTDNDNDNEKEEKRIDYTITDSIIDYFNEKTGKNLRHKDVSRKPIKARLNENFTFEDCKQVIDIKYDEWIDDENMAKFIRISTFFGNKFEIYLNQQVEEKLSASAREMMKRAFSGARL